MVMVAFHSSRALTDRYGKHSPCRAVSQHSVKLRVSYVSVLLAVHHGLIN
jgi:hypothetical protein